MASPRQQQSGPNYEDVDRIDNVSGVTAIISKRLTGVPKHTIGIFKVYTQDGEERKTSFFDLSQVAAVQEILEIAGQRAAELQAKCEKESAAERGKALADGVSRRQPA